MSKIVYLSPSTQERNIGYGNYSTEEKRMNGVADVVQEILVEHGIKVYIMFPIRNHQYHRNNQQVDKHYIG